MAPTKFRAVGAAITKLIDTDTCMIAAVLSADQKLDLTDEKRWIKVEMLRTPSRAKRWSDVWFDDRGLNKEGKPTASVLSPSELKNVGITSVGPLPHLPRGQYFGAVYLRDTKFKELWDLIRDPKLDPSEEEIPWKPSDWAHYELTSLGIEGDPNRYVGMYGEVTSVIAGSRVKVRFPKDRSGNVDSHEVDLKDAKHCAQDVKPESADPIEAMLEGKQDSKGGVYLNLLYAAELGLRGPKLPIGMG